MNSHPFLTGIGLGMMAGAAVGATVMKNEKSIKRYAHKTVKQAGRMAENAAEMVADKLPR